MFDDVRRDPVFLQKEETFFGIGNLHVSGFIIAPERLQDQRKMRGHLLRFSAEKQACGPEARALRAKSIGGGKYPFGGLTRVPLDAAGASGTRSCVWRDAPTSKFPLLWEKVAYPPGPRREARLMIFARNALASGPGIA